MMEGLKEALQYITGLKAESMEPKVLYQGSHQISQIPDGK